MAIFPNSGRTYDDALRTPVPYPAYRCKASVSERSPHNHQVLRKHLCKITVDHTGDHACLCGKTWERTEA